MSKYHLPTQSIYHPLDVYEVLDFTTLLHRVILMPPQLFHEDYNQIIQTKVLNFTKQTEITV